MSKKDVQRSTEDNTNKNTSLFSDTRRGIREYFRRKWYNDKGVKITVQQLDRLAKSAYAPKLRGEFRKVQFAVEPDFGGVKALWAHT